MESEPGQVEWDRESEESSSIRSLSAGVWHLPKMREPDFARRVGERRAERVTEIAGLLAEASIEAAAVLRDRLQEEHILEMVDRAIHLVGRWLPVAVLVWIGITLMW